MTFGTRLKAARKRANLTQEQLGDSVGVTAQAVSQWERDETVPETEHMRRIAKALGVSIDELHSEADWRSLEEPHDRLQWARKRRHPTVAAAARAFHIAPDLMEAYESGALDFTPEAARLAAGLLVNETWLTSGRGGPESDSAELLNVFGRLAPADRAKLLEYGQLLSTRKGR